ncbi:hypothetical protein HanPI659440_Chr14g0529671 [Helianthus annuus]|nr:hypothetical protein HanPI659440_Chr14g0529671 [Helianthus annuus]
MMKTLLYRKYQRRIHHAFTTLHPSRYLYTNQKPIVYPIRITCSNRFQIVNSFKSFKIILVLIVKTYLWSSR